MSYWDKIREAHLLDPECLFLTDGLAKSTGHPSRSTVHATQFSEEANLGWLALDGTDLRAERDPEGFEWADPPAKRLPASHDYLRSLPGLSDRDPNEWEDGVYRATRWTR